MRTNFFDCRHVFDEQSRIDNEIDDVEKRSRACNIEFNDIKSSDFFCNELKKRERH